MLSFIVSLLVLTTIVAYLLFYSKSKALGKILYALNNSVEARIAGLSKCSVHIDKIPYIYLANKQLGKPILLLLHGFSADKNIWLKFARHAMNDYFVIIPDLMGHGEIPYNPNKNYSTTAQVRYVSKLMIYLADKYNNPGFTVVGNSMGGMMAAQLLEQWDSLGLTGITLDRAALLDPAGAYSDFALEMHAQQHNPFLHLTEESVFNFYKLAMNKPPFMPPSVFYHIAQVQYLDKYQQHQHMFSDFFNINDFFKDEINVSGKSVLLIWGDKDGLLPVADAQIWETLLSTKAIVLAQIGHMPMAECPLKTYRLLQETSL